jgi:hypothetical protein
MDYTAQISKHFTFHEALWLPTWRRHGDESDGLTPEILSNLTRLFLVVDQIRDFLDAPFNVHCAWRPVKYNALPSIRGAARSAHLAFPDCAAVDFDVQGKTCADVQAALLKAGLLASLSLRMEDHGPNPSWVHLDNRAPLTGHPRFFRP